MSRLRNGALRQPGWMVARLLDWFAHYGRDLPWRRSSDPYAIWISEVMLQQTQVNTVIPYWTRWMKALPDVRSLAEASESQILKLWEGLGYYRRARNLQTAARILLRDYQGSFPTEFESILALPGIGRYTAGAIGSIAFNQAVPIVDGNVARVLARVHAIPGDPRKPPAVERFWKLAADLVEIASASGGRRPCSSFNQALMELGATVCLPQNPLCSSCPIEAACRARDLGKVDAFPGKVARPELMCRHFMVIVACDGSRRFCIRQRAATDVNGGLWEFPNLEVTSADFDAQAVKGELFGRSRGRLSPLTVIHHGITRYRITEHVFRFDLEGRTQAGCPAGIWRTAEEMESIPFPSAHRRIRDWILATPVPSMRGAASR